MSLLCFCPNKKCLTKKDQDYGPNQQLTRMFVFFLFIGVDSFCCDMESKDDSLNAYRCPREEASWLSKLTFSFCNPILKEGNVRSLTEKDVWGLEKVFCTDSPYVQVNHEEVFFFQYYARF